MTPGLDKIATTGLRYNQFHTTALCSPTRAALLTGRNHHSVHMGGITEIANSFPGYDSAIPPESATVAQVLRMSGYSTSCFGKWHLAPSWEQSPAGPFDRWPTGLGFDRFYGIMGAESSQWEPPVYDQTTPIAPHIGKPGYHLTEDLADQAITWMQRQHASTPNRPFFCYFSTPAVHAPHHVSREWIDKFKGQFDDGWDALRDMIYERQLKLGVIPKDTTLTKRPEQVPAWADYPDRYKPVARRLMETFAGFLAHTDAQIARVIDSLDGMGIADNTLVIYITGDNGASAEGTIHGAWSAPSFQNGVPEDPEWLLDHMDDFGTDKCENHFNVGWAWALDSPFQWMKQVASHFGGTRNAMALSWPKKITDKGGLRTQFHHVIDIVPTIYDIAGITPPTHVNGVEQMPLHGTSMAYTFDSADAPSTHTSQYFEILGNRAIYADGWMASCFHGRLPWIRLQGFEFDGPQEVWELYNIAEDFSQAVDLAATHPEKLVELQALFHQHAIDYGIYPLLDPGSPRHGVLDVHTRAAFPGDLAADAGGGAAAARLHAEIRARRAADLSRRRPAAQMDDRIAQAAVEDRVCLAARDHRHHRGLGLRARHPDRRHHRLRHLCAQRSAGRGDQIRFRRLGVPQLARPRRARTGAAGGARPRTAGAQPAELPDLRLG